MSLINQVLNDLKKRGSGVPDTAPLIRPVADHSGKRRTILLAGGMLVLAAALGGALWVMLYEPPPDAPQITVPHPGAHAAARPGTLPAPVMSQPASALQVQPVSAALAQSAPAVQAQSAVALNNAPRAPETDALPLRPSFELASQPSPASATHGKKLVDAQAGAAENKHEPKAPKTKKKAPARPPLIAKATEQQLPSIKQMSRQQQADGEYNQAADLIQQGRGEAARPHLENALQLNPSHVQARLMLATLLLGSKRNAEAESLLQKGLQNDPTQARLALLLARIQVDRGALPQAVETLRKTLPSAEGQPDYQAFMAAILQRQNAHEEAVLHYQAALRQSPNAGVWWMGLGISLQALKRKDEARDAFKHAIDAGTLSAELQDYVKQRMKDL